MTDEQLLKELRDFARRGIGGLMANETNARNACARTAAARRHPRRLQQVRRETADLIVALMRAERE